VVAMSTDLGETSMDISEDTSLETKDEVVVPLVPMEVRPLIGKMPRAHPPSRSNYVVRPCYKRYFDYILTALRDGRHQITLTGTPGIGKSVFIDYFIEEYFKQDPETVFIVIAFSKDGFEKKRNGAAVVSLSNGVIVCNQVRGLLAGGDVFDDVIDKQGDRHLVIYDGWSNVGYLDGVKTLCCTSPNYEWYRQNDKARDIWIYMPLWSRDEIETANYILGLNLYKELNKRIDTFGLTVRYVLETDSEYVQKGVAHMESAWQMFDSFEKLEPFLDQLRSPFPISSIDTKACHRMFHYSVPGAVFDGSAFNPKKYELVPSSEKTENKLEQLVLQLRETDRRKFVSLLTSSTKTAPLVGRIFESVVHERFVKGFKGVLRYLGGGTIDSNGQLHDLVIPENQWYRFRKIDAHLGDFLADLYLLPDFDNLPSVDGWYFDSSCNILYFFQMSTTDYHPVGVSGMFELDHFIDYVEKGARVVLVFVVPSAKANSFSKQKIIPVLSNEEHIDMNAEILPGKIFGIGKVGVKALNGQDIRTYADLSAKSFKEPPSKKRKIHHLIDSFRHTLDRNKLARDLVNLEQYVLGVELPGYPDPQTTS
jgi:hypothetical protein